VTVPDYVPAKTANLASRVPAYLTADAAGNLYFVDNHSVIRLDAKTGLLIGGRQRHRRIQQRQWPRGKRQLEDPQGLTIDSSGNLCIADTGNNVVRKFPAGPSPPLPETASRYRHVPAGLPMNADDAD
jgi:hypothetical protein